MTIVDLSILRDELRQSLHANDLVMQRSTRERAGVAIEGVEKAVMDSRFLHDHYRYDPELTLDSLHFSQEEEALARSGLFTEDYSLRMGFICGSFASV